MKILRLEVQGFRSFSAPQILDFTTMRPGLYHVTGKNLIELTLEANGAGKSSLFEAIFWALYGKTSRNLRAGTVKNWNGKEKCGVVLDVVATSGAMSLLRMWGPNALEISGEQVGDRPVDQPELERLIGMTPEAFLFAFYFAQFSPAFVDLVASEQTTVFASVLNLGLWERASDAATRRSDEIEQQIQQLRETTARIQGQAEELLSQDYVKAEKGWVKGYRAELQAAEDAVLQTQQTLKVLDAEMKVFLKIKVTINAQMSVVNELTADFHHLSQEMTKLSAQNITKCPTCGQTVNQAVSRQHIKKELARVKLALDSKGVELSIANKKLAGLRKQIPEDCEVVQRDADREQRFACTSLSEIQRKINPYTKLREEQERRGEQLAEQLDETESQLHAAEKHIKTAQYWIKGFKEIRLSLIQESLAQLTIEVNETLFQLGLQDWSVEFDIERETKSGSINRSFTIMVRSPHTKDAVPWGVWSGGESQRLRLAISMGFSNLICNRMGVHPNLEMWDEPSTWMSEAGIQDLLMVLAERAKRQQKVILLADHRALDFGGFAGTLTVTKDDSGSHVSTV